MVNKEEVHKINPHPSLILSFDDETDSMQFVPQSGMGEPVISPSYDFSNPLQRFNMDVSYDNVKTFYHDLGFNDATLVRLKPYFSTLENFIHYDVFAMIERFEADILVNDDNRNSLSINTQQDFYKFLRIFGFRDEWAQTYTWAIGKAYASQLVKHSIEECIRLRLSPSNTIQPYPEWSSDIGSNQWQIMNQSELEGNGNFFIRNQPRRNQTGFSKNINDIDFNELVNLTRADHPNSQYWFHATDWSSAKNILISGSERRGDNTDFARGGAYYLNNDYRDCYEFLFQREHKFKGEHAILIYEFDPRQLSNRRYLYLETDVNANQQEWQQLVFSCININASEIRDVNKCECVFGWQCANPNAVRPRQATRTTPKRRTRAYDSQYAVQLAIRTNRMLVQVDNHLIGVVLFEHL